MTNPKVDPALEKTADIADVEDVPPKTWGPSWLSPPGGAGGGGGPAAEPAAIGAEGAPFSAPGVAQDATTGSGVEEDSSPPLGRPWKPLVASWPERARDVWAELADELEVDGLPSKLAEAAAFLVVRSVGGLAEGGRPETSRPTPPSPPPPSYPWREVVAEWPDRRRQRWGELANAIEESGKATFPDSERLAFEAIVEELEQRRKAG